MSTASPTKRSYSPNTVAANRGLITWFTSLATSSVGAKVLTALTGTALTLFVIGHLVGNLKIFAGRDAINSYAHFLKEQGMFLWIARIGLLAVFVAHLSIALWLKLKAKAARPVAYAYPATIQASVASRTMPWTGLVILAFLLFHLAHYTLGMVGTAEARNTMTNNLVQVNYLDLRDEKGRHDVYSMMIAGFKNPIVSGLYIVAQLLLCVHLSHGIASAFQSLGLNSPKMQRGLRRFSWTVAILIAIGNIAIVVAVWTNTIGESYIPLTSAGDSLPLPVMGSKS
jgi:succinate dehydrogenase / fumarate reductase cytochrome b subunit